MPEVYSTPNFTPGRTDSIRKVIVHSTRSGRPSNDDYPGTIRWFQDAASEVSAHRLIGLQGQVAKFVEDEDTAWHAGSENPSSLGIEFCQSTPDTPYTDAEIIAGGLEIRTWLQKYPGITVLGHENTTQGQLVGKTDPGALFPWPRLWEVITMPDQELVVLRMQLALIKAIAEGRLQDAFNILKYVGCR